KLKVDSYPFGKLNISDILLASKIEDADGDPKYTKNGLKVIPNPARIFHRGQLMYVYFEIYDLIVNTSRKTKFQVEYTVSSVEKENIPVIKKFLTGIGKLVGMKEEKNEISASYEYEGTYPTDKINLSIDMSATKTGLYNLAIKVKDINSGKEISKNVRFGVQGTLINYLF
ncbi:hypothetical protein KAS50_08085, partial [bacterium]|nr:hypothetical protein [bacterium]